MRNDVIKLITKSCAGATVSNLEKEVFAEKKSITRSEFYASYQVGLSPKYVFSVDTLDFEAATIDGTEPTEIVYKDVTYAIIRTYEKGADIELTVGVM